MGFNEFSGKRGEFSEGFNKGEPNELSANEEEQRRSIETDRRTDEMLDKLMQDKKSKETPEEAAARAAKEVESDAAQIELLREMIANMKERGDSAEEIAKHEGYIEDIRKKIEGNK